MADGLSWCFADLEVRRTVVVPVSMENGASGANGPTAVAPAAMPIVSGEGSGAEPSEPAFFGIRGEMFLVLRIEIETSFANLR